MPTPPDRDSAGHTGREAPRALRPGEREAVTAAIASPSTGLEPSVRSDMEVGLGHALDDVHVHRGAAASDAAGRLGASALAIGSHVVFAEGRYAPGSIEGRRLLAHELAHVVQRGDAPATAHPRAVSSPADPAERQAGAAAARVASGTGAVAGWRPSPLASGTVHRDFVRDLGTGQVTAIELRAGIELRLPFMVLAKRLLGGGVLHDRGLGALRHDALASHGTVDDYERMFMAGLTQPGNAALLAATPLVAGASVTFPVTTITPNLRRVADLEREAPPLTVTRPVLGAIGALLQGDLAAATRLYGQASGAAEREIRTRCRPFDAEAGALLAFATGARVPLPMLLAAMLAAGSDSSAGDRLGAGIVYAVAAAAAHPMAAEVYAGRIKVDALVPTAFALLPVPPNFRAFYVTAAQGSGVKGDTIYVPTDLNVADVYERSAVIHELTHAQDDLASTTLQFRPAAQLEAAGYRGQGRYLLEQLAAVPAASRPGMVASLANRVNPLVALGMAIECLADRPRLEPLLAALGAAATPAVTAADIARLLNRGTTALETDLRNRIATAYSMTPGQQAVVEGLSGESQLDWINR